MRPKIAGGLPGVFSLIYTEVAFVGELRWWGFAWGQRQTSTGVMKERIDVND
jgi:hypothetical protein